LRVRVEFVSFHRSVSIGLWKSGSRFRGTGKFQWKLSETSVSPQSGLAMAQDERICVLDVGARDGLSPNWERLGALVRPVLVEPDPVEAARLTERYHNVPGAVILQQGLAESAGRRTLYVTRLPHCSSLLEPNGELLSRWNCAGWFAVEATAEIDCASYAELVEQRLAPNPDIVKIDVQGYEFEVLQGMGSVLDQCLAVELEAHVLPIYKNQRLLCDIVALLDDRGMSLRGLRPVGNFNGDVVEFDAVFIRRLDARIKADPLRRRKLARTELLLGS
jgi:FkbM family methyltransferase